LELLKKCLENVLTVLNKSLYYAVMDKLQSDIVGFALSCLTDKQRRRYVMYLNGATLTQIAEKEQISVVTVHLAIKSIKKKIKSRLEHLKTT